MARVDCNARFYDPQMALGRGLALIPFGMGPSFTVTLCPAFATRHAIKCVGLWLMRCS